MKCYSCVIKKVFSVLLLLSLLLLFTTSIAELRVSEQELQEATDEELETLRLAIVTEQRNRIKTKIIFDQEELTLHKGSTTKLNVTIVDIPDNVKTGKLLWSSADKSVAIAQNGSIRAVGEGKTLVTCTSVLSDGTEISANCSVTVCIPIKSIKYKNKYVSAFVDNTYYQEIYIQPEDASNKNLKYDSSNKAIATVDANGLVTVVGVGKVTITATTTDGSEKSAAYTLETTVDKTRTGEFVPYDFGYSPSLLFSKRATRTIVSGILAVYSQDTLGGKGPLSFDSIKDLIRCSSWLGITEDEKELINIGYFNDKRDLLIFEYNARAGLVKYNAVKNNTSTDAELASFLSKLFTEKNVSEYYEILPDEKISALEDVGMSTIRRLLER